jgi:hypothetical protein
MDFVRSCYSTEMRFISNSDRRSPVRWFFAAPTAAALPFPHRFASLNWGDRRTESSDGLGEVPGASRPWRNGSTAGAWPAMWPCGEAFQWAEGTVLLSEEEAVAPDGVPRCCGIAMARMHLRLGTDLPFYRCELALRTAPVAHAGEGRTARLTLDVSAAADSRCVGALTLFPGPVVVSAI